jgi:hypothetical protein
MARHEPNKHSQDVKVLHGGLVMEMGKRMPMFRSHGTVGLNPRVPFSLKVPHVTIPSQSVLV